MRNADLIALYSGRLLELAASIPHIGRLDAPEGSAKKRSAICGSTIIVDVTLAEGRIRDFAQEVRACALGQASASILGRIAPGRSLEELRTARDQLQAMLKADGPVPVAPFDGYEALLAARDYANRHASILLALEATIAAAEAADESRAG